MKSSIFYFRILFSFLPTAYLGAQNFADFTPISDFPQNVKFAIPTTHTFQKIIEVGDNLTAGGVLHKKNDFAAFVPIVRSSINGYLSINHEDTPGGVTVLDINFDENGSRLWNTTASEALDFTSVGGTQRNCSGGITPWGTVLTCEESVTGDNNNDGYNDMGWAVEIDPVTKTVLGKRWAMGNFAHENAVVHRNERTVYQGIDAALGHLYKFVANTAQDLSAGLLYVYKGPKSGTTGTWELIANTTIAERNSTVTQSTNAGARDFDNIEDVEIGPDGYMYFTSKVAGTVYRFQDSDPINGTTIPTIETFVDGIPGCDNLAFDCEGNLWIYQDGGRNHIWIVRSGSREKEIFARLPTGSEPTGITFSPDCRFLFMSIQHPSSGNMAKQQDAAGVQVNFNKSITLVVSRKENLGNSLGCSLSQLSTPISAGINDVEEYADGTMYTTSSDLELVNDPAQGANGLQTIGLRFDNLLIPKGVKITNAYIQFTTDEINAEETSVLIQGEAVDNSDVFTTINSNLSNRTRTTSCVPWSQIPNWSTVGEAGINQRTADLSAIVEEIIDRPGWSEGNALSFIISGTGRRVCESYESGVSTAPELIVELEICPPSNCIYHSDQVLTGNLPTGTSTVGRDLIIQGNMIPNNQYYLGAGNSITMKPNSEICNCGTVTMAIEKCED